MTESECLFPDLEPVPLAEAEPVEKLSADRRRTLRQRRDVERGVHPLTGTPTQPDPAKTCGTCVYRLSSTHHNRSYPKCYFRDGIYATFSAASDVRAWWPGCSGWTERASVAAVSSAGSRTA